MFDFIARIPQDFHPIVVHFPIALLMLSFGLTIAARRWAQLHETSWLLLILGGLSTIPAVISGLIAHEPYEESSLIGVITIHQFTALIGSLITLGVLGWRWRSRRRGGDIGRGGIYLGIVAVGIVWLMVLGGTGGQLTYEYGINVRGVNPLLP